MMTKQMKIVDNKLYIGCYSAETLAKNYHTPLYVFDEEGVRSKMVRFTSAFKSNDYNTHVVYATKAFLAPYMCKLMNEYGIWADAISLGDLYLLERAKFLMNHIVLHGNNKTLEEIEYAVKHDVGYIVVDNYSELVDIVNICEKYNKDVNTLLRINPGVEAHTHAFIQTANLDSKFGISILDKQELIKIFNLYKKNKHVILDGFHAHIGSQISEAESFEKLVPIMTDFVKEVKDMYDIDVHVINYGGGFGVKYLDSDKEIDIEKACQMIIDTTKKELKNSDIVIDTLMIEPGRSIVGDNCVTLYETRRTKTTLTGTNYAFVDGGMPDNIRPALYDAKYSVVNASQVDGRLLNYTVAGKCCESGDIIARDVCFTKPDCGDILAVFTTGAYCYSMSMNYNGLTRPAVIFVRNDTVNVAIRKEEVEDLVNTCEF